MINLVKRYGVKFQEVFGVPLAQFMDPIPVLGFDVIAFDEWLGTPDGTSTYDYLLQKYGKEAQTLIKSLLG